MASRVQRPPIEPGFAASRWRASRSRPLQREEFEAVTEIVLAKGAKRWAGWVEQSFPELPVRLACEAPDAPQASLPAVVLSSVRHLRRIRAEFPDHVLVALCSDGQQARRAIDQGAFDALIRPFDRQELERIVAKALNHCRQLGRLCAENARLRRLDARRKTELQGLLEIGKAVRKVTSSLDIQEILTSILHGIQKALSLDRVLLGLVNKDRGLEEFKLALGIESDLPRRLSWTLDGPLWKRMTKRNGPILIEKQDTVPQSMARIFPETFAKCPLIVKGQVLGSITCGRSESAMGGRDLRLLRIFSEYAAIAIQNGRLYYDVIRSEEQLKRAHQKLLASEKMALIGHMAVSINHEINNPLCNISLITQTVANELGNSSPRMCRLLRDVDSNVERIQQVTRKISGMRKANLTEYLPDQLMVDLQ